MNVKRKKHEEKHLVKRHKGKEKKGGDFPGSVEHCPGAETNTNAISNLSLRGAERRSNPMKNEIAAPFGLAMTPCDVEIFNAFVLVHPVVKKVQQKVEREFAVEIPYKFYKRQGLEVDSSIVTFFKKPFE